MVRVVGLMSGTSLDGVDAAILDTDGVTVAATGDTAYRPYSDAERRVLRTALGTWPGDPLAEAAARVVEAAHLEVLDGLPAVDLVGFHGQTLAHDPAGARTHQAGDGARLARALGVPVVWDFRSNDMALGGQGAPLAPFYHWACARAAGVTAPLAVLNLGGVGNITWVDPQAETPDAPGALLAFDTGPGNAAMDDLCLARGLGSHDAGGALARRGRADAARVKDALVHPFFYKIPPKSLDRGDFSGLAETVADLGDADALATLAAITVMAVARGLSHAPRPVAELWVTGGGRHNGALMAGLKAALRCPVLPVEERGLDGDALEAQAFAYLAARVRAGLTTSAPGTTGIAAPVGGGRLSHP